MSKFFPGVRGASLPHFASETHAAMAEIPPISHTLVRTQLCFCGVLCVLTILWCTYRQLYKRTLQREGAGEFWWICGRPPRFGGESCPTFGQDSNLIYVSLVRKRGSTTSHFFLFAGAPCRVPQARFLVPTWYAIIQMTLLDDWCNMVIALPGSASQSFTAGQLHSLPGSAELGVFLPLPKYHPKNRWISKVFSSPFPPPKKKIGQPSERWGQIQGDVLGTARWWVTFFRCGAVGCLTWSSRVSTFHRPQLSGWTSSGHGTVTGCGFSAFSEWQRNKQISKQMNEEINTNIT